MRPSSSSRQEVTCWGVLKILVKCSGRKGPDLGGTFAFSVFQQQPRQQPARKLKTKQPNSRLSDRDIAPFCYILNFARNFPNQEVKVWSFIIVRGKTDQTRFWGQTASQVWQAHEHHISSFVGLWLFEIGAGRG